MNSNFQTYNNVFPTVSNPQCIGWTRFDQETEDGLMRGDTHIGQFPDENNNQMIENHTISSDKLKLDQTAFCTSINFIKIPSHSNKQYSN